MKRMKDRKAGRQKKIREFLGGAAFIAPSFLGVFLFFILPFGVVVYYSLINNPIQHEFVFLDNFRALLKNSAFKIAAK